MIAIVNVSDEYKEIGEQDYEIRINRHVITTFTHNYEDGLAICLLKAGMAVTKSKGEGK